MKRKKRSAQKRKHLNGVKKKKSKRQKPHRYPYYKKKGGREGGKALLILKVPVIIHQDDHTSRSKWNCTDLHQTMYFLSRFFFLIYIFNIETVLDK